MAGRVRGICQVCGSNVGFRQSDDGFFYCCNCNSQAEDMFDAGVDEEEVFNHYSASCNRLRSTIPSIPIVAEPISQVKLTESQYMEDGDDVFIEDDFDDVVGDGVGPTGPSDFGTQRKELTYEEYYTEIRSRYLTGLQIMIQMQCKALVEEFNVSPLIVGLVGPVWLRYLASSKVLADEWADQAVHESETQTIGEAEPSGSYRGREPTTIHGKRVVYVWYKSLNSTIPISSSLAISLLVCHIAREAILPSDMLKWILEGKLPYFAAFGEIEKQLGSKSQACPISASHMFRPVYVISSQKLESMAAVIAHKIGLELPPVNFYAIASRYCRQLSLPTKDILPLACHLCQWSMPSELYLSTNEYRIPTRAFVMSILIVAIRILFDINGYGIWENSLSDSSLSSSCIDENEQVRYQGHFNTVKKGDEESSDVSSSNVSGVELLRILEAKYSDLADVHAYSSDLESYLKHCKEVVFSGLKPSHEDFEEEKLIEEFWDFYQKNKGNGKSDNQPLEEEQPGSDCSNNDRSSNTTRRKQDEVNSPRDQSTCSTSYKNSDDSRHNQGSKNNSQPLNESFKDQAIRKLKLDMEENKFCYIPPRVMIKRRDYLHYARKRKDVFIYAVHADYYILLRSCAKAAQVETRIMHIAVLSFERRLAWLEKKIESALGVELNLDDVCEFCEHESVRNDGIDHMEEL